MKHLTFLFLLFMTSYTSNAQSWAHTLGSTNIDQAVDITVDAAGNSYIVGFFSGTIDLSGNGTNVLSSAGQRDIFFAKYDAVGNLIFAKGIGGSGNDEGNGIALDNTGNIIIVGNFSSFVDFDPTIGIALKSSAGSTDIFVAKYDVGGSFVSVVTVEGTGTDRGEHIVRNGNGDIYITGLFTSNLDFVNTSTMDDLNTAQSSAAFLAKFDALGNYIWSKKIESTDDVRFNDLALDASGNLYGTGIFKADTDFNPSGNTNILSFAGNTDAFVAKYNLNGSYMWARALQGIDVDVANGIDINHDGNILVTGVFINSIDLDPSPSSHFITSVGQRDVFMASYTPSGAFRWGKRFGGTGNDYGYSITSDNQRRIFVAGTFQSTMDANPDVNATANLTSAGDADMFFVKFDSIGNYKYSASVGGSNGDLPQSIHVDNTQQIYATGWFQGGCNFLGISTFASEGDRDIFTAKIDASLVSSIFSTHFENKVQVSPNPFTDFIRLENLALNSLDNQVILTDVTGRIVADFQNVSSEILHLPILENGIYFLNVRQNGELIGVAKLVKH